MLTKRQTEILDNARVHGTVRIGQLATEMDVSLETIRRDIRPLVDDGKLVKLHGAISLAPAAKETPFERRMRDQQTEKRRIAKHLARKISDGDSVMMDAGTTTSVLARELLAKSGLTIVTNSSDVARTLATVNGNKVYMAGGELHGDNGAAFGPSAIEFIGNFTVGISIISIAAISAEHGLMDYHLAEAEFARTVLARGHQSIVITDHTKFDSTALVKVCDFDDFDILITDQYPQHDIAERLLKSGTGCEIAGET